MFRGALFDFVLVLLFDLVVLSSFRLFTFLSPAHDACLAACEQCSDELAAAHDALQGQDAVDTGIEHTGVAFVSRAAGGRHFAF